MNETEKIQARLRLIKSDDFDLCSSYSFKAASPLGAAVRSCSMSLTDEGASPMSSPISASVSPVDRRSETRDAHVLTKPILRDAVEQMQRHPVSRFRESAAMPRPSDLPSFQTLGARIAYWRQKRGWDRRELAKRAKIPYSTLAGIEDEDQKTSTKTPQIAAALGISSFYLATDKGDPETTAPQQIDAESWPLPFSRDELLELDPNELELAGMKFQKIIEEIRAKRPKQRHRKAS